MTVIIKIDSRSKEEKERKNEKDILDRQRGVILFFFTVDFLGLYSETRSSIS
jgi:hypothetical protein